MVSSPVMRRRWRRYGSSPSRGSPRPGLRTYSHHRPQPLSCPSVQVRAVSLSTCCFTQHSRRVLSHPRHFPRRPVLVTYNNPQPLNPCCVGQVVLYNKLYRWSDTTSNCDGRTITGYGNRPSPNDENGAGIPSRRTRRAAHVRSALPSQGADQRSSHGRSRVVRGRGPRTARRTPRGRLRARKRLTMSSDTRYRDEQWFRKQYSGRQKTMAEIADDCGVRITTISKWGRKHGIETRSQKSRVETECANCGAEIEVRKSRYDRSDDNFCDTDCMGEWTSENRRGTDHPRWVPRETVECTVCGSEFKKKRGLAERSSSHLCSVSCESAWRSTAFSDIEDPNYRENLVACAWCGKVLDLPPSRTANSEHNFCSSKCTGAWLSENLSGEDHPNSKGLTSDYRGPNWEEQRHKARIRDQCRCADCGRTDPENIEQFGCQLPVHHIIPRESFRDESGSVDYESANEVSNLVTLCSKCHPVWEQMAPLTPLQTTA